MNGLSELYTARKLILCACILMATALVEAQEAQPTENEPEWRYSVRPKDTLIGFSKKYLIDSFEWKQIQSINKVINPRRLQPGQVLRIPLRLVKQKPTPATLSNAYGDVQVIEPGANPRAARSGESLNAGTLIITAKDGTAKLTFADESSVILQPDSSLALDAMSIYEGGGMVDTKLRLQQGRAEARANPTKVNSHQMQIITPSAVAAVRGTQFRVNAEPAVSREETTEGLVALTASGQGVQLPAGYGSVAEKGKPPSPAVLLLAAPDVTILPVKIERLPMRFDLQPQAGAVAWHGQISTDKSFERVLIGKKSDTPRLSFSDLPDGPYLLRLRAEDGLGLIGLDAVHTFELNARPFAPLLLSPKQSGLVRSPQPELKWSEAQDAKRYLVMLANDAAFSKIIAQSETEAAQFRPSADLEAGEYFWRVASIDTQETGPFSDVNHFIYKPLPAAPSLTDSALKVDRETMEIALPMPEAGLRYEVELYDDKERKRILWKGVSADGKLKMPRPNSGKRYLSVRMLEDDGTAGPYATQGLDVPSKRRWEGLNKLPILDI